MNSIEEKQSLGKQRIVILLDGNNFYNNVNKMGFGNLSEFNFSNFAEYLARERDVVQKFYYKGVIQKELDNKKSQEMVTEQQRLFAAVQKGGWGIKRGRMQKSPEYKKSSGVYFCDEKIKDYKKLQEIGKELLKRYPQSYNPIIIITSDFPYLSVLKEKMIKKEEIIPEIYLIKWGLFSIRNVWREKGVDVELATDMMAFAYENICDGFVIISDDTDIMPAIKKVAQKGKFIEYVGFEISPPTGILQFATSKRTLDRETLQRFFPQKLLDTNIPNK